MPALCSIYNQNDPIAEMQNLQLNLDTTHHDLQTLLSTLVENSDDDAKYAFYINDVHISETLGEAIYKQNLTLEQLVIIKAVPQEKTTVSALSRCSAELPGHEDSVLCVQFAPDSRYVASGSGDKTVRIWDCQTATCRTILQGHNSWVLALKYSPDGTRLVSADYEGGVFVWNCENYTRLNNSRGQGRSKKQWVTTIQWHYDSKHFYTGCKEGVIRMYSNNGSFVNVVSNMQKAITSLTATARYLIAASEDCSVNIYSIQDYKLVHTFKHAHWVNYVDTSVSYYVRFGIYAVIRLFQQQKKIIQQKFPEIKTSQDIADLNKQQQLDVLKYLLHQFEEKLITASDDHTMKLYQLHPEFKLIQTLSGHAKQINQAVFSPNQQFIASCSFDRTVRLWGADGRFLSRFQCHASEVYQVAFSADGRLILSGGKDSTCKIYSIRQQKLLRELPGHADAVYCVDWSLSGEYGVSGSKDRMVKLWRS